MILTKTFFLVSIFFLVSLHSKVIGQESFIIKKKTIDENNIIKKNDDKKKPIKNNTLEKSKNSVKEAEDSDKKIELKNNNVSLVEEVQFRIVYKPNQTSLTEQALIKVIEISDKLSTESIVTIRSYASKNVNQSSSDARRLSLSRALEARTLFIENGLPATNIIIKALGTQENNEGYSDILVISIN